MSSPSRLRVLFDAAVDLPEEERMLWLRRECEGDDLLFEKVAGLLEEHVLFTSSDDFDEPSSGGLREPGDDFAHDAQRRVGTIVGRRYRLQGAPIAGGMGAVYRAECIDRTFDFPVAVKMLGGVAPGPDATAAIRLETRVLAALSHPGIARFIEASTEVDAEPYLVMEWVDGVPITQHADERRLTIRERVKLFRRLCEAIAHAHQALKVHRDIKPANVLVDSQGQPKVVDFGIAALKTPGGNRTNADSQFLLRASKAYAAPEHRSEVEGDRAPVDIYSLGVLLHELLTDRLPVFAEGGRDIGVEPLLASRSVHAPLATNPSSGESGPFEPWHARSLHSRRRLAKALDGDLDAIVRRCLAFAPAARYPTVNEIIGDLDRYLAGEIPNAREASRPLKALRAIARHPLAASAIATAIAAVLGIAALAVRQQGLAEEAALKAAERLSRAREAMVTMLAEMEALAAVDGTLATRQRLAGQAKSLMELFEGPGAAPPVTALQLANGHRVIGDLRAGPAGANTGERQLAGEQYLLAERYLQSAGSLAGTLEYDRARIRLSMSRGDLELARRDAEGAERHYAEAEKLADDLVRRSPGNLEAMRLLADVSRPYGDAIGLSTAKGRTEAALQKYERAENLDLRILQEEPSPDSYRALALSRIRVGRALADLGRFDAAQQKLAEGDAALQRAAGPQLTADALMAQLHLAIAMVGAGRPAARDLREVALARVRRYSDAMPTDAQVRHELMVALVSVGDDAAHSAKPEAAASAWREALSLAKALAAGREGDEGRVADVTGIEERLARPLPSPGVTRQPRILVGAGEHLREAGPVSLRVGDDVVVEPKSVPVGAYIVAFGADGPVTVLDHQQLVAANGRVGSVGATLTYTVLAVAPRSARTTFKAALVAAVTQAGSPRHVIGGATWRSANPSGSRFMPIERPRGDSWGDSLQAWLDAQATSYAGRSIPVR